MSAPAATVDRRQGGAAARRSGVHVVTVTYDSASTIERYFEGIERCRDDIAAVTIVDNGSRDGTVPLVRALADKCSVPVELLLDENTGFAGGYHAASRGRLGDGLPTLCLNPDVVLDGGAVGAMLEVLRSFPDAAVITVPLVELDGSPDTASRRRLPTLGASMLYSLLGRFTPNAWRYNRREDDSAPTRSTGEGTAVSVLQATTGAVMLVPADFRTLRQGIFDRDYWMYGEDLQLCADAAAAGRSVLIAEVAPSMHVKGVSSGRPRSRRSNRAFHDAMTVYARKNLVRGVLARGVVHLGIEVHFLLSELQALRARRARARGAVAVH